MRPFRSLALAFAALVPLTVAAGSMTAQNRPTPSQAEAMIRANPELLNQLRERIMSSGMTPEQVRARLRAEGYPETLLDPYLDRSAAGLSRAPAPGAEVFSAVRDLGLTDDADLAELMRMAGLSDDGGRGRVPERRAVDSLSLRDSTISRASAEIFGLSLFRSSSSLFLPNLDGPVDAGYRVGPGDQLTLILTGDVEQAHTLDVSREGQIRIPDVGLLGVANLTLRELEDLLYARLGRVHSGVRRGANATTQFSVSVTRLRSNQVFVTGDVMAPGSYRVTSAGTALTALYAAGGPTDRGSLRRIEVRRGGKLVSSLDVYDYLVRGDASRDVRLRQGDIVHVPIHGPRVRVDGAVARPATYEANPGEGIAEMIEAAGGLRAVAGGHRLVVERVLPMADRSMGRQRAVIDVPLGPDGSVPTIAAADGDLVRVPGISDRVRDRVVVRGHVWSPGPQGFTEGLTLAEALRRAGGLQPDAYLGTVHVSRLRADSTRVQLRAMLSDTTGATVAPLALQGDDEVTVYSRTEFRPDQYVVIGGAVRDGKRYPWREGMTLRDLVLLAGGLDESAYLREAEIARMPAVRDPRVTAATIRVPLDSGYRFELASAATTSPANDITLQPYDNVLILRDPDWREPRSVWLTGEVRFPGRYTLTSRGSRLSDVIRRAGGLTAEANPAGAYFTRLADTTLLQRVEAARRGMSDTLSFSNDTTAAARAARAQRDSIDRAFLAQRDTAERQVPRIRVGVDLRAAMRGRSDDLTLNDGDSLHVPSLSQIVEVRGAVNAPTALAHRQGASLGHYVSAAGGTTELARSRRAYVIQPSGKIESRNHLLWLIPMDPTPLPGSVVVVPERPAADNSARTIQTMGIVAQVLASLATIIVISR